MRLRVEWGGEIAQGWQGRIECANSTFSELRPLGLEADAAATQWIEGAAVVISQRSAAAANGLDVTITGPADGRLVIGMAAGIDDGTGRIENPSYETRAIDIPLSDLLQAPQNRELDDQGSRITIARAPGDQLRVRSIHRAYVFAPGDSLRLEIEPYALSAPTGARVRFEAELRRSDAADPVWKDALWSKQYDATIGVEPALPPLPVELTLPKDEGAYHLKVTAWTRSRLAIKQVLAERHVQLVVVGDEPRTEPQVSIKSPRLVVTEIDPAHPTWWNKVSSLSRVPGLQRGPWGNGQSRAWQHALGSFVLLGQSGREQAIGWEAYPLSISSPGKLHWLEIEHPSNVPQTLGISIVEPGSGSASPLSLDSGFYVPDEAADSPPHIARQRIPFWPRSKAPVVLLTNRRDGSAAAFGKIRAVEARDGRLPYRFPRRDQQPRGRMLAAYLDRPLLPENFGAAEAIDGPTQRPLDDWITFQQAGDRLVEYLHHCGYNGLLLTVMADGGAIYPSEIAPGTPRYDSGAYSSHGQDPQAKDVLELLFRQFDREGLRLVPVVQFASPLPKLEALLQRGGEEAAGIQLVGPEGRPWSDEHPPRDGLAPYYNPLNPRVQQAMLEVLHELAARYRQHPSFGGLAIQLSADGYAQLPSPQAGLDDPTIERFSRETGRQVPGAGTERFAQRWAYLSGKARIAWLEWRAKTLEQFFRAAADEIIWARADAALYLAGTDMFDSAELAHDWRPSLPRRTSLDRALLDVGISPNLQRNVDNVVFFRPQRIGPPGELHAEAVNLEFNESPELDKLFREASRPAALFYHPAQAARLVVAEQRTSQRRLPADLLTQFSPSEERNRRRFVHALATLDAQVLCDGGRLLPLGQEEALADVFTAFRSLPAQPFATLPETPQPATIRTWSDADDTYIYLVNDSPWPAKVQVRVATPDDLPFRSDGMRGQAAAHPPGEDGVWTVFLQPYDLAWGAFPSPQTRFSDPQVSLSRQVAEQLEARLNDLQATAATLQSPTPLAVPENAGFEGPADAGPPPGWTVRQGIQAVVDASQPHEGEQALRIGSSGQTGELVSEPFDAPTTGRLAVSVWLRVPSGSRQPPMRLAVEGQLNGREYYRYASVGAGKNVAPVSGKWSQYIFQISDLPLVGLSPLRVRFDLLGAGDVSIDKLQLYDLVFSKDERIELDARIVALARAKLRRGEVGDCLRILDGYWPRMLAAHVQLSETQQPTQPATVSPPFASRKQPADDDAAGLADTSAAKPDIEPAETPAKKPAEPRKPSFFERVRGWMPGRK